MKRILLLLILLPMLIFSQSPNPTNTGIDFTILLTAFIGAILGGVFTIIGGYFQNKFASTSQLEHYRRTVNVENRKEWIKELTNLVSEFVQVSMEYYWKYEHFLIDAKPEDDEKLSLKSINLIVKLDFLHTKLISLISFRNEKEIELYTATGHFYKKVSSITTIQDKISLKALKEEINESAKDIRLLLNKVVQEEQAKLKIN